MNDLIALIAIYYALFSFFFGSWYMLQIIDCNKKVNWKVFPIYFLLGAPGFITIVTGYIILLPICWIMDHWPKNMGPFK